MADEPGLPTQDDQYDQGAVDSTLDEDTGQNEEISPEERRQTEGDLGAQQENNQIPRPSEDGDADADLDEPELHQHDTQ